MPLNLKSNFKPRVAIKKSEVCSWKRHFHGCARDLIGFLELLAKNSPDRFVIASVPGLTKGCNGKYRENKTPYSKSMVEKTLLLLREHKIVSRRVKMHRDGVERDGFVVADHKSMTVRYPLVCVVAGLGKGPGTWVDGIWVKDAESSEWFGQVTEITPQITGQVTDQITVEITPQITVLGDENYGVEGAGGCAGENLERGVITEFTDDCNSILPLSSLVESVPSLVSQLTNRTNRTKEPRILSDHLNGEATIQEERKTVSQNLSGILTDEEQRHDV